MLGLSRVMVYAGMIDSLAVAAAALERVLKVMSNKSERFQLRYSSE
jgi:hypothetical protein